MIVQFKTPADFFRALGHPCRTEEEIRAAHAKRRAEAKAWREEASKRVAAETDRIIAEIRSKRNAET